MNKHIIFSFTLISMGVLHAQKETSHPQTDCQIPSKEDLQNSIPGYLTFIKNKINVTDNKIMELLDDFLNHTPSNKPINVQQGPSSLINPDRSRIPTESPIQPPQNRKGANDIPEKVNTDPEQSNAREEPNINRMNVGHSAETTKCRIDQHSENYYRYNYMILNIKDHNITISGQKKERKKHAKKLNNLLLKKREIEKVWVKQIVDQMDSDDDDNPTKEICIKSKEEDCKRLLISIAYSDTIIDESNSRKEKLIEDINSLCDEEEEELLY